MLRAACLLLAFAAGAAAQPGAPPGALPPMPPDTTAARFATSTAVVVRLDEYGFGLGTAGRARLTDGLSFTAELAVGAGKDAREQQFFVGFFGDSVTPFKRNYVLLAPLHFGLEQRLFRRSVEDNFRPFVAAAAGPSVAVQWPYFDDLDGDGVFDRAEAEGGETRLGVLGGLGSAEPRVGVGGSVALGAYFGRSTRTAQGLRFAVVAHHFPAEVDLLELVPEVEDPSSAWFVSPVVSFHLVRLLN